MNPIHVEVVGILEEKRTFDILKKLNLEMNSNSQEEGKRKGYEKEGVGV